jgi:hypothetical protein
MESKRHGIYICNQISKFSWAIDKIYSYKNETSFDFFFITHVTSKEEENDRSTEFLKYKQWFEMCTLYCKQET